MTKKNTQCKITRGLVDGLCARHRAATATEGAAVSTALVLYTFLVLNLETGFFDRLVGPFSSKEECLSSAVKHLDGDYEETDVTEGCEAEFKNEKYHIIVSKLTPPEKKEKTTIVPSEDVSLCSYMYKRGARKGEQCTAKKFGDTGFCTKHKPKVNKPPEVKEDIPESTALEVEEKDLSEAPEEEKDFSKSGDHKEENTDLCAKHKTNKEEYLPCQYMFKRGKHKGEQCTAHRFKDIDFCVKHEPKSKIKEEEASKPKKITNKNLKKVLNIR